MWALHQALRSLCNSSPYQDIDKNIVAQLTRLPGVVGCLGGKASYSLHVQHHSFRYRNVKIQSSPTYFFYLLLPVKFVLKLDLNFFSFA